MQALTDENKQDLLAKTTGVVLDQIRLIETAEAKAVTTFGDQGKIKTYF
jgi:hypothetical protein